MTSNHLEISFVWKSLVAICVYVWLKFERVFQLTRSSPTLRCSSPTRNVVISSDKSFPVQHKTCLSLAINAFVCTQQLHAYVRLCRTYMYMCAIHEVN